MGRSSLFGVLLNTPRTALKSKWVGDSEQIERGEKPAYGEQWCGLDTSLPLLINEK